MPAALSRFGTLGEFNNNRTLRDRCGGLTHPGLSLIRSHAITPDCDYVTEIVFLGLKLDI